MYARRVIPVLIAISAWCRVSSAQPVSPVEQTRERIGTLARVVGYAEAHRAAPRTMIRAAAGFKLAAILGLQVNAGRATISDGRTVREALWIGPELSVGPQLVAAVAKGRLDATGSRASLRAVDLTQGFSVAAGPGFLLSENTGLLAPTLEGGAAGLAGGWHVGARANILIPTGKARTLASEKLLRGAQRRLGAAERSLARAMASGTVPASKLDKINAMLTKVSDATDRISDQRHREYEAIVFGH